MARHSHLRSNKFWLEFYYFCSEAIAFIYVYSLSVFSQPLTTKTLPLFYTLHLKLLSESFSTKINSFLFAFSSWFLLPRCQILAGGLVQETHFEIALSYQAGQTYRNLTDRFRTQLIREMYCTVKHKIGFDN